MQEFKGKKILFIGIGFYDYDEHITRKIEKLGGKVDYLKDSPTLNFFQKVLKKILNNEAELVKRYFEKSLKTLNEHYDFILVIKGDKIPETFLKTIRVKFKCPFILYQWDSVTRVENFNKIKKYFDRIITFDRVDSIKYEYEFRPLFFKDLYLNNKIEKKHYDLFFSGYLHSDRYDIVKYLLKCNKNIKFKYHLFINWFYFLQEQIIRLKKSKSLYNKKLVSFFSISESENREMIRNSIAILDIHHPLQSGLTMRTIEALGMGSKIITTNKDIKNYNFYNPNSILIVDRNNIQIPDYFFEKENNHFTSEDKKKYSLEQWVIDVFKISDLKGKIF